MNKKGQYQQMPQRQFASVSPILIIGIIVFVLRFFNFLLPFKVPNWVSGVGLVIILIGGVHSIMMANGD